jgi:predicted TPR repeat methyltransferase
VTERDADGWLQRVFGAGGDPERLAQSYDAWADSYDLDMLAFGYLNPPVVSGLIGRHVHDRSAGVLDAGCGTGLIGEILAVLGYRGLVGLDLSQGMLAKAAQRQVYSALRNDVLGQPIGLADEAFGAVVATGVFTLGHAPPGAVDELVRLTRRGGHLVLSVASSVWESGGYKERFEALERAGAWRTVEVTQPYRPMPLSQTAAAATTRSAVFLRL